MSQHWRRGCVGQHLYSTVTVMHRRRVTQYSGHAHHEELKLGPELSRAERKGSQEPNKRGYVKICYAKVCSFVVAAVGWKPSVLRRQARGDSSSLDLVLSFSRTPGCGSHCASVLNGNVWMLSAGVQISSLPSAPKPWGTKESLVIANWAFGGLCSVVACVGCIQAWAVRSGSPLSTLMRGLSKGGCLCPVYEPKTPSLLCMCC